MSDDRIRWQVGDVISTRDFALKIVGLSSPSGAFYIVRVGLWTDSKVKYIKKKVVIVDDDDLLNFLMGKLPGAVVDVVQQVQPRLF